VTKAFRALPFDGEGWGNFGVGSLVVFHKNEKGSVVFRRQGSHDSQKFITPTADFFQNTEDAKGSR
jgi:hypothetical protein